MALIPGGAFQLGALDDDSQARLCERPRHRVVVADFLLDVREVTVTDYTRAVAAGVVAEPVNRAHMPWHSELATWGDETKLDHPINGVTWAQADGYCRHRGARLPTEAEFEYALRTGGSDGLYPWGDNHAPPEGAGNHACSECPPRYAEGSPIEGCDDGFVQTAPVGSFAPDAHGVYDLSGNVWEWCSDWYWPDAYSALGSADGLGSPQSREKILRGGGHHCVLAELRSSERHHKRWDDGSVFSGFRCAADITAP